MRKLFLPIILSLLFIQVIGAQEEERKDALKLYQNRQFAEAVTVCQEELLTYTDSDTRKKLDAYTVMVWSYIGLKNYDNAVIAGKEGLAVYPYDSRIIFSLGEANYYRGNYPESLSYFEQYSVLSPTGSGIQLAYFYMGETYLRQGKYSHADIAFSTALYHAPDVARWWTRLGYAREQAEDYDESKLAYEKALELQAGQADALAGLERLERIR